MEGAADGGVGAVALAEGVAAGVHADFAADGAVHHHDGADEHGGGEHAVHGEGLVEHRLDGGQHDGEVFRLAASHHRVDGDFFHGGGHEVGRDQADHFLGVARGAGEHAQDAFLGGGDEGEAVGPAAVEHRFHLVLAGADGDAAGDDAGFVMADFQAFENAGFEVFGAAAGAHGGEGFSQIGLAGQALPFRAVPAIGSVDFLAALKADQGGDNFDAQAVGGVELAVIDAGGDGLGKVGVVLGVDGQAGDLREDRGGEDAGWAVAFDDGDEAVLRCVHWGCLHRCLLVVTMAEGGGKGQRVLMQRWKQEDFSCRRWVASMLLLYRNKIDTALQSLWAGFS